MAFLIPSVLDVTIPPSTSVVNWQTASYTHIPPESCKQKKTINAVVACRLMHSCPLEVCPLLVNVSKTIATTWYTECTYTYLSKISGVHFASITSSMDAPRCFLLCHFFGYQLIHLEAYLDSRGIHRTGLGCQKSRLRCLWRVLHMSCNTCIHCLW